MIKHKRNSPVFNAWRPIDKKQIKTKKTWSQAGNAVTKHAHVFKRPCERTHRSKHACI